MTPPLRADAARNRERLLETARLAVDAGDLSLQLNDIARRAGVGVGTAYRHFPTRRALLEALADPAFTALLHDARAAGRHHDVGSGVEHLLRALLTRQLNDPAFFEVISTGPEEDADPRTTEHREEFGQVARAAIERARRTGAVRAGLTDADLHNLVCGTVFALRLGQDPQSRVDDYLRVLLNGIRA
ncbi:TetR/AcrR family transcriptional regulator [Actinocorallia populi]|uniref:TetR/AcrR family transcriptional regulator n=1 Tax=Actinocorallia populi TaxID=2079200 RepID=UPI000D08E373|nr:TetR/AcrR family transcriptional regulator [Actinocorallia populi]